MKLSGGKLVVMKGYKGFAVENGQWSVKLNTLNKNNNYSRKIQGRREVSLKSNGNAMTHGNESSYHHGAIPFSSSEVSSSSMRDAMEWGDGGGVA